MRRRLTVLIALLGIVLLGAMPSEAAPKKKSKPKPISFSYEVSLTPDPTPNVTGRLNDGCSGVMASGKNIRPFTAPAAGRLKITLVAPDPTGRGIAFDWDLWLIGPDDSVEGKSNSEFTNEMIDVKFKKKIPLSIQVCQLSGLPAKGKVTVSFVYA